MNFNILKVLFFNLFVAFAVCAPTQDCECGIEGAKSRIRKGSKVGAHKYPWMAHVRAYEDFEEGTFFQCGGSLIDNRHVITAAHCLIKDDKTWIEPSEVEVYLGAVKISDDDDEAYTVKKIWVDPLYNDEELSNDFAILTLSSKVKFSREIGPICLPQSEDDVKNFTVAGWGRTNAHRNGKTSDGLLETQVNLIPKDKCGKLLFDYLIKTNEIDSDSMLKNETEIPEIAETHLCAINYETGGDACSGDSGGPLMHLGSDGRWYLMGVVSGSWEDCGVDKDAASLYTRVLYYKSTIEKKSPNACWGQVN